MFYCVAAGYDAGAVGAHRIDHTAGRLRRNGRWSHWRYLLGNLLGGGPKMTGIWLLYGVAHQCLGGLWIVGFVVAGGTAGLVDDAVN